MKIRTKLFLGFAGFVALIAAMLFISLYQLYHISVPLKQEIPRSIKLLNKTSYLDGLAQFIRYYDEVLTQSARNYALTQNKKWEIRYKDIEPKLDSVIKEAISKGDKQDKRFFTSVDKANLALVKMEYRSIKLVDEGKNKQAIKILESKGYWDLKNKDERGIRDYVARRDGRYNQALSSSYKTISDAVKHTQGVLDETNLIIILLTIIVLCCLSITFFFISRSIFHPITMLQKLADKIGGGNLDAKLNIQSKDEIGALALSFTKMAKNLAILMEREKEFVAIAAVAKNDAKRVEELTQEIVERKKVEKKLRRSEKRNRAWIEHSPVCTKIVDLDFNLQFMSTAGTKGLQIEDITKFYGKPYPFDFYPDSFKNRMSKNLRKAREIGKIVTQEASVVDINGNEVWYHSTIVPVNDDTGKIEYLMVVSVDTTEQNKAKGRLKVANIKIEKAHEHAMYMLAVASEYRDTDTGDHIRRISAMTKNIALEMGLEPKEAEQMASDSLLHDLGKIGEPDSILLKHDELTDKEFEMIKRHTVIGASIIGDDEWFMQARQIALSQHKMLYQATLT